LSIDLTDEFVLYLQICPQYTSEGGGVCHC